MPPLFIWHTYHDKYVPVINPVLFADKMIRLHIPFELHIFEDGEHGMSACNTLTSYSGHHREVNESSPNVREWVPLSVNWLKKRFKI